MWQIQAIVLSVRTEVVVIYYGPKTGALGEITEKHLEESPVTLPCGFFCSTSLIAAGSKFSSGITGLNVY